MLFRSVGGSVFYACQKDNNELQTNTMSSFEKNLKDNSVFENLTAEENQLYEEFRLVLCEGLISFNESVRPYFDESTSFDGFCNNLEVNRDEIMPMGMELLRLSYQCLSRNYSEEYIFGHYTGKGMYEVLKYTIDNPDSDGREIFATESASDREPCKWWQIGCHFRNAWNWVKENWETIAKIATFVKDIIIAFK